MTISISTIVSTDLFADNDAILFDPARARAICDPLPEIGAITFVAPVSGGIDYLRDAAVACGKRALDLIHGTMPENFGLWLFAAQGPWQPATRIVKYYKFWRQCPSLLELTEYASKPEELGFESGGEIRFAGVLGVAPSGVDRAIEFVRANPAAALICSNREQIDSPSGIRDLFAAAFPKVHGREQENVNWMHLALYSSVNNDLLLRVCGIFDDREASVDIIGANATIAKLADGL